MSTPYHPQTDGLVQRYNRTLKSMLKKCVAANSKDWDHWLPYPQGGAAGVQRVPAL